MPNSTLMQVDDAGTTSLITEAASDPKFSICPPPDKSSSGIESRVERDRASQTGELVLLVVEFELSSTTGLYRATNLLVTDMVTNRVQLLAVQWSQHVGGYFLLTEQGGSDNGDWQAAQVQCWPLSSAIYWTNKPVQTVYELDDHCTELEQLPQGFELADVLSSAVELDYPPLYCQECCDYYPAGQVCQHLNNGMQEQEAERAPEWAA